MPWPPDSNARAKALPLSSEPRKPATSDRKRAADEAIAAAVARAVTLSQTKLAQQLETPQSSVCDMQSTAKPYPMRMVLMVDTAVALELVDELRDMLREKLRAERSGVVGHGEQIGTAVASSQRVRSCAALTGSPVTGRAAFAEHQKSTLGRFAARSGRNGGTG